MKLFGGYHGARTGGAHTAAVPAKRSLKPLAIILAIVLAIEGMYFIAVYSKNAFITKWRNIYITTAMETMNHQWLATAIIPMDIIEDVVDRKEASLESQENMESSWGTELPDEAPETTPTTPEKEPDVQEFITDVQEFTDQEADENAKRTSFYSLFHELDPDSFEAYLDKNPQILDNGWENIYINEAGLDDEGTDIMTTNGDQVLAIDVPNKILLIRVKGEGYRGILAIGKDPAQLSLQESAWLGTSGQTVATIATRTEGVLAMTGSGFNDPDENANGGILSSFAMCHGVPLGTPSVRKGDKRIELHENNLMYIVDTKTPVSEDCTDAAEWQPAVIIDGKDVLGYGWDGLQPRAIIGQSSKYEIMMLVIEGRAPLKGILGITLYDCADLLLSYNCMQAMNLDGGTSAIMWYNGETITNCSNTNLKDGRTLPTAFVYGAK